MSTMDANILKYALVLQTLLVSGLCDLQDFRREWHVGGVSKLYEGIKVDTSNVKRYIFEQFLDHFNPTDSRLLIQRFFVNDEYYNPSIGGPVFLMIGGESVMSEPLMVTGAWIDYAKQFGALCFQLEHRYYGESFPVPNITTENFQYLSSKQALADIAAFVDFQNKAYNFTSDTKWIVFGGSYAGSLAAWARLKYPHLIHGAVSSSAPLLAKADFGDFLKIVAESYGSYSKQCKTSIANAMREVDKKLHHLKGQQQLTKMFNLCSPLHKHVHNHKDVAVLYETINNILSSLVVYDNIYNGIKYVCDTMTSPEHGSALEKLANIIRGSIKPCLSYEYNQEVEVLKNGYGAWLYQTCTEFGFYATSSKSANVFGNHLSLKYYEQLCMDVFGANFNSSVINRGIHETNRLYGGLDIEVTNVVFVQGSLDPWHALGIVESRNSEIPAIYIEGGSHCADFPSESETDSEQLKAARKEIRSYLGSWLGQQEAAITL